jgi:hypothetical protein
VVSGGKDGTLRCWDLADGSPRGEPLKLRYDRKITSAAVGDLDGRPFIVAAYARGGTIALWDLGTGQHLGVLEWESSRPSAHKWRDARVYAVAAGRHNGRPIIVAGYGDGAHLWAWTGDEWAPRPLIMGGGTISSVALASLGGRPIAVCGGSMLSTVDLETCEPATPQYRSPDGEIIGVAAGDVDGHAVAVTGNFFGLDPGIVRVWDLADDQEPLRGSLTGHYGGVQALAITHLDGRAMLVSGGFDHAVCVWDLAARLDRTPDRIEYQHISWLEAGEVVGGRPVVTSKSSVIVNFSKDRAWQKRETSLPDPSSRIPEILRGDAGTSPQWAIRFWDQTDGALIGAHPLDPDNQGIAYAAGRVRDALVVASVIKTARPECSGPREEGTYLAVTDLRSGVLMGRPIPIHEGSRGSIAIGAVAGRPVVAFSEDFPGNDDYPRDDDRSEDNRLQVWDVQACKLAWQPLPAYSEHGAGPVVRAVGAAAGQPIAVVTTPARFGIWDLQRGELLAEPPSMQGEGWTHPPAAIGELAGRPVAVYSGYGRPIRIWDYTADHECQRAIEVDAEISAITIAPDSTILAGGPAGMLAVRVEAAFFDPLPAPRERRTKAKDAQVKVFSVAGPADGDYLASISPRRPSEGDLEHYAQLREKLGETNEGEPHCGYDRFGRLVLSGTVDWYDGATETRFAVRWPFLRMEYRPLWSGTADLDDSAVFRGDGSYGNRPVYIFHQDGRIDLLPGEDLDWDFSWGDEEIGSYNLGVSVCRAAGLLRGQRRKIPREFEWWLEDLIQNEHHPGQPLKIPVSLVRKKFRRLKEVPGDWAT